MSPTIRSLVIPVSDLDVAKAVYSALLGAPHTDESYYVGYNINGIEVGLNPAGEVAGPVAFADVEDLDAARESVLAAGATERDAPRVRSPRGPASACSPTRTATRSACAESSRRGAVPPPK